MIKSLYTRLLRLYRVRELRSLENSIAVMEKEAEVLREHLRASDGVEMCGYIPMNVIQMRRKR